MSNYGAGWNVLISELRKSLEKIAPNLHVTDIREAQFGGLRFYYSDKGLTPQQQAAVDARVKRAEDTAWITCTICGELGRSAYTVTPPRARVFCEKHKPLEWNFIEG